MPFFISIKIRKIKIFQVKFPANEEYILRQTKKTTIKEVLCYFLLLKSPRFQALINSDQASGLKIF